MAVYTKFNKENIEEILSSYAIGKLNSFKGIQEGIENSDLLVGLALLGVWEHQPHIVCIAFIHNGFGGQMTFQFR